MGKLYLDENDRVHFDQTTDGRFARRAAVGRCLMRLASTTEQLVFASARVLELSGRSDPHITADLRLINEVRRAVRSRARKRRAASR